MKIRIQGNSIRIRLSKPEVIKLENEGNLVEKTSFGKTSFHYRLESKPDLATLFAAYDHDQITLFVPKELLTDWAENNIVGFDAYMQINETETLYLLLEKDFKCLDNVLEGQSDNFENPKSC